MGDGNSGPRVALVTGVAGYWGARVASRLTTREDYQVLGLDAEQLASERDGLDFVQADMRNTVQEMIHRRLVHRSSIFSG